MDAIIFASFSVFPMSVCIVSSLSVMCLLYMLYAICLRIRLGICGSSYRGTGHCLFILRCRLLSPWPFFRMYCDCDCPVILPVCLCARLLVYCQSVCLRGCLFALARSTSLYGVRPLHLHRSLSRVSR